MSLGVTRIARLWSYAVDDRPWQGPAPPAVVYLFAETRKGRHVAEHLTGFNGWIPNSDAIWVSGRPLEARSDTASRLKSSVNDRRFVAFIVINAPRPVPELARGVHPVGGGSPVAEETLRRLGAIYEIEARIRGASAGDREKIRLAETKPLFDELKPWLMDRLSEISAKSPLAEAIRYTLGHWDGLTVFLTDGRVEVDNNIVERTIRPIALGRRNALFAGSASGGQNWACLASLINTAKLHEIDPQTYLVDVLDRIVSGQTKATASHELLPWNWKAAREARAAAA